MGKRGNARKSSRTLITNGKGDLGRKSSGGQGSDILCFTGVVARRIRRPLNHGVTSVQTPFGLGEKAIGRPLGLVGFQGGIGCF